MAVSETVHQLKATIRDTKPPVWRRVAVTSTITLAGLHDVLQAAFGWMDCHLHEFDINGSTFGMADVDDWNEEPAADERGVRLCDVAGEGTRFEYWYDFGDDWRHQIVVEKVMAADPKVEYPLLVTGRRACPPEDCGGTWGYENFLAAIADPNHEEHEAMLEWGGEGFDPDDAGLDTFHHRLATQTTARAHD